MALTQLAEESVGGDCRSDMIMTEEENETFCARAFPWTVLSSGTPSERWESYVSHCEKKMKDKLDDEIKLAGLDGGA